MANLDNLKNRIKTMEEKLNPPETHLGLFRELLRYHRQHGHYPQLQDLDPKDRSTIEHFLNMVSPRCGLDEMGMDLARKMIAEEDAQ